MQTQDAILQAQSVGGLLIPKTETHFVEMMQPTAKRHMVVDGKVGYQAHKWKDALSRFPDRRVYLDIGAHCALWAWFLSKRFRTTVAIEAAPLHAALFRANIYDGLWSRMDLPEESYPLYEATGHGHGHVILHECAVGAEKGTVAIECAADETGSAHVAQKGGGDKRRGHGPLITYPDIPMITVDHMDFPDKIDFVKIDVEGFELPVVKGAEETFKHHKPWMIIEQKKNDTIYGDKHQAATDLLKSWGWTDQRIISGDHCMAPPS